MFEYIIYHWYRFYIHVTQLTNVAVPVLLAVGGRHKRHRQRIQISTLKQGAIITQLPTTILDTTAKSEPTTIFTESTTNIIAHSTTNLPGSTTMSEKTTTPESTMPESITIPESTTMSGKTTLPESTTMPESTNISESTTMLDPTNLPETSTLAEATTKTESINIPENVSIKSLPHFNTMPQSTIEISSTAMLMNNDTQVIINTSTCVCFCKYKNQTLEESVETRRRELTLNKTKLSSTVRRLTSAADHRVTSRVIGTVAIIILTVCGMVFFCADMYSVIIIGLSTMFK